MSKIHLLDRRPPRYIKAPACHAGIPIDFLWTRSPQWVTCKGCKRTRLYRAHLPGWLTEPLEEGD